MRTGTSNTNINETVEPPTRMPTPDQCWLSEILICLRNETDEKPSDYSVITPKAPISPPIFIEQVNDSKGMIAGISSQIEKETLIDKSLANDAVCINATTGDNFRKLIKLD